MSILGGTTPDAVENSSAVEVGRKVRDRIAGAARTTADHVRKSAIYAWLTKEPEPEVIVIDLRETRTVGPFIRLLDGVVDRVEPIWNESRVKAGVDRGVALAERGLDTRPGRLLVALLEPPDPPEATTRRDGATGIDGSDGTSIDGSDGSRDTAGSENTDGSHSTTSSENTDDSGPADDRT